MMMDKKYGALKPIILICAIYIISLVLPHSKAGDDSQSVRAV